MTALIDGDIIVYQAAFAAENGVDWGDGDYTLSAHLPSAQLDMDSHLEAIKDAVEADRIVVCLSDTKANFRKEVYPDYKSQRKHVGSRKPLIFKPCRDYLRENYEVVQRPSLEADDVMGILATGRIKAFRGRKVICSIDKDMLTIPGLHYNWRKRDEGVFEVEEIDADWAFYKQVLTGDSTDGYPGCPKYGPVKSQRLLEEVPVEAAWPAIVKAYESQGLTEEDAVTQARCARILRASDYDFKKKEVRLWLPPNPNVA